MRLFSSPSPNSGKGKRQGVYTDKQAMKKAERDYMKAELRKVQRQRRKGK